MTHIRSFLPLLIAYVASYAAWQWLLGPGFANYKMLDFSHYLAPEWLANNLFQSLLLLHSQPPLMNLLIGIIFKITPEHYEPVFRVLYFALGAASLWQMQCAFRIMGISRIFSVLAFIVLLATPTFYMMATWLGTTHIEFFFVSMLVRYLAEYLTARNLRSLVLLCVSFALLALIRPQWHLAVFAGIAFLLMLFTGGKEWRKILLCSFIFLLPVSGWYAKNQFLFGFFGPSSWMGSNLALVADLTAKDLTADGVAVEVGSPDFPAQFDMKKILNRMPPDDMSKLPDVLKPFKSMDAGYLAYTQTVPRGGSYVRYNLNYIGIIASSKRDGEDAKKIIREHPRAYLDRVLTNIVLIIHTPSYLYHSLNMISLEQYASPNVRLATIYGAGVFYALVPLLVMLIGIFRFRYTRWHVVGILFLIALYILLSSAAINGYEGERLRWAIQPIYMLFAVILLENIRKYWQYLRYGRTAQYSQ